MTLTTLKRPLIWPGNVGDPQSAAYSQGGTTVVDAAGEYNAWIICASEDMTISHVALAVAAATGSPTADVRIETVDSSGLPSGTLWATNTNIVTGTLTVAAATHALTASATITKGQIFCIKVAYNSGTSFQLYSITNRRDPIISGLPYIVTNTGTPTKGTIVGTYGVAPGSSSSAFYAIPGLIVHTTLGGGSFNNTNGARRGMRFTIPFNCRCSGVLFFPGNVNGDFNIIMMSDAGSELSSSSTAFDGDQMRVATDSLVRVFFDNAISLTAGTTYRAVIEPSSATNTALGTLNIPHADYRSSTPGGTISHYTTYASAAWDDTSIAMPMLDLLIDQIDDGAGGGGGGSGASFSAYAM